MQYNKYVLALALLASSAFASTVDFETLAGNIVTNHSSKNLETLKTENVITEEQAKILDGVDLSKKDDILKALTDAAAAADKAAAEKKAAEEKAAAEKAAAEKAAAEKAAAEKKAAEEKEAAEKKAASIKAILDLVKADTKKIDGLTEQIIKDNNLRADQVEALKAAENVDEAAIITILEQAAPVKTETEDEKKARLEKEAAEAAKAAEAAEAALKILADNIKELIGDKKFADIKDEELVKLNVSADQIVALRAVTDLKAEGAILDALKTVKPAASGKETGGEAGVTGETTKDGEAFYKKTWFMATVGVLLLAGIGGGAFMMTRKTEETDL